MATWATTAAEARYPPNWLPSWEYLTAGDADANGNLVGWNNLAAGVIFDPGGGTAGK